MKIEATPLVGCVVLTPTRHGDARGYFSETWNATRMAEAGYDITFVQDNQSLSERTGTLRGLHYQAPPAAQAKLVRCGRGALWDVAVDIRQGSPTYGQWFGTELSIENGRQLLVPEGFAHGFVTLTPDTEILYKCSAPYAPQAEGVIHWDDSDLAIEWPLIGSPVLSDRDAAAPTLAEAGTPFGNSR